MKYVNKKNGTEIDTTSTISSPDWELLEQGDKKETEKVKDKPKKVTKKVTKKETSSKKLKIEDTADANDTTDTDDEYVEEFLENDDE